ncbi:unnamed protein product [Mytilus coruscus]|uniref:Uncharacterized protein n=1 Tax=Mytilus coruscus TaxID=42192 RepID=A0A6J8A4C9_MYTCO|nr:unnamed protein product [Mytilus coruscus]
MAQKNKKETPRCPSLHLRDHRVTQDDPGTYIMYHYPVCCRKSPPQQRRRYRVIETRFQLMKDRYQQGLINGSVGLKMARTGTTVCRHLRNWEMDIKPSAGFKVAVWSKENGSGLNKVFVEDLVDAQSNAISQLTFSTKIEETLRKNNNTNEANLWKLIRE